MRKTKKKMGKLCVSAVAIVSFAALLAGCSAPESSSQSSPPVVVPSDSVTSEAPSESAPSESVPTVEFIGVEASSPQDLLTELLTEYGNGADVSAFFSDSVNLSDAEGALSAWKSVGGSWLVNEKESLYDSLFAAQHALEPGEGFINFMGIAPGASVESMEGIGTICFIHDEAGETYLITFITFDISLGLDDVLGK
jgi:hypothetical protein